MPVAETPVVRVPASSANLGAGFDVLGLALDLYLDVGVGEVPDGAQRIDAHHPAAKAFAVAGGADEASIWLRSAIPMGRGLGFSGAAHVGGAALAVAVGDDDPAAALAAGLDGILDTAAQLEGHGDNAAASVSGGIVAWVGGRGLPLRIGPRLAAASVVTWIPDTTTSTDRSRRALPEQFDRVDVVGNLGRVAQFVMAVEHDDPTLLVGAADDRLHQPIRLPRIPGAGDALAAGVAAGAWCGWLSGSGPTVALLTGTDAVGEVVAALPGSGHVKQLRIARRGVHLVSGDGGIKRRVR
jgi:homoserine kinase